MNRFVLHPVSNTARDMLLRMNEYAKQRKFSRGRPKASKGIDIANPDNEVWFAKLCGCLLCVDGKSAYASEREALLAAKLFREHCTSQLVKDK